LSEARFAVARLLEEDALAQRQARPA